MNARDISRDRYATQSGHAFTHIFFGLFDSGRDDTFICEGFILGRIDLVFPKYRKRGFDVQFLVANLAGCHG